MTLGRVLFACAFASASATAALGALGQLGGCVRHADIRDEPDAAILPPGPQVDAGDIPDLDSGLGTDAYPACLGRPEGDCLGPSDFPCAFEDWMKRTAASCQESTGCKTDGWLEVKMGAEGCIVEIGMDAPNDDMIACLLAEFGSVRCPCGEALATYLFGYGNMGVCVDAGG